MNWRCLNCFAPLSEHAELWRCTNCGRGYPVVAGIPILVSDPEAYVQSELRLLHQFKQESERRGNGLDDKHAENLLVATRERHRDVAGAHTEQADVLLRLLEPAANNAGIADLPDRSFGARRMGWTVEDLIPYLLRDWAGTKELDAASTEIGAALKATFPNASEKSIAVAACGGGGLLPRIALDFGRVVGYDLTLAILGAARHLLDGHDLDVSMPRANRPERNIRLHNPAFCAERRIELVAMDALHTALADESIDCVVTSFLLDLMPDPQGLAGEIYRVLSPGGAWINYGPSGPLKAPCRFDRKEGAAFFESVGFRVEGTSETRATYIDLSDQCQAWNYRVITCYLTVGRKAERPARKSEARAVIDSALLSSLVPRHFPNASLVQRQSLTPPMRTTLLRYERLPGRVESVEIGDNTRRLLALVDGAKTTQEIAEAFCQSVPGRSAEEIMRAFAQYFERGYLTWRD